MREWGEGISKKGSYEEEDEWICKGMRQRGGM